MRNSEAALGHSDFSKTHNRFAVAVRTLRARIAGSVAVGTIMYDSTDLFAIPSTAKAVASYLTGFPQSAAAWARFSGKLEIKIVQHPGIYDEGDVLDVENGGATLSDVFPFISHRKAQGYHRPTIYTSASWVPSVRSAAGKYVLGVDYDLWVASWTGAPHVGYPGAAATQYASFRSYDLSVIHDAGWPHRSSATPPPPPPPPPPVPGTYKNPLRSIQNLRPERIDQGVDYAGSGPLFSIGNGVVLNTVNAGWPGGAFIAVKLSDGAFAGKVFYFAENITPAVRIGQKVTADTVLGTLHDASPNCELGWADPGHMGESLARANGQVATSGDPGNVSSAYGKNFSDLLVSLGAPAGIMQGARPLGSLPADWPKIGGAPKPPPPPPPPATGPFKHVADGTESLGQFCSARLGKSATVKGSLTKEVKTVIETTMAQGDKNKKGESVALVSYLLLLGGSAPMPKGLVVYTVKP